MPALINQICDQAVIKGLAQSPFSLRLFIQRTYDLGPTEIIIALASQSIDFLKHRLCQWSLLRMSVMLYRLNAFAAFSGRCG